MPATQDLGLKMIGPEPVDDHNWIETSLRGCSLDTAQASAGFGFAKSGAGLEGEIRR